MRLEKASFNAVKYACMNFHYAKRVPVTRMSYSVFNDIGAGKAYGYGYGYGYGYKYNYAYNYGYGYGYAEDLGSASKKRPLWKKMFRG